ncbi:CHAT domain-containing protein [Actinosynnema pretiosum subsp. pretiosum]|uniref:CHAT domain-containing protein n=1 Tax=Actinosynnema pretiosum subsp. pretiosum TaxID=103721 RepID=A0AA45L7R5_9PSEU|nr:CHAT domain-containing protein [Actinosynnema pretiosum subsp. pretiosum]
MTRACIAGRTRYQRPSGRNGSGRSPTPPKRFHHLWHIEGHQPAEALRRAQTWLRDTNNAEKAADLTTTGDKRLARALRLRDPSEHAHRHPRDWAAFSYHCT